MGSRRQQPEWTSDYPQEQASTDYQRQQPQAASDDPREPRSTDSRRQPPQEASDDPPKPQSTDSRYQRSETVRNESRDRASRNARGQPLHEESSIFRIPSLQDIADQNADKARQDTETSSNAASSSPRPHSTRSVKLHLPDHFIVLRLGIRDFCVYSKQALGDACKKQWLLGAVMASSLTACATGFGAGKVAGNEKGSAPVNEQEALDYKKAITRCYKSGGNRIVKVMGELKCY